jgi:glycosyltransferase Alg8
MTSPTAPGDSVALEADIARRLSDLTAPAPRGLRKWTPRNVLALILTLAACAAGLAFLPNHLFDPELMRITWVLGLLGLWRFGWWFNHARRSEIFMRCRWPDVRARRDRIWRSGWRPGHLHVQMTTFHEEPAITRHVMAALFAQIRETGIPTTIWIGTGALSDEEVIEACAAELGADLDAEIVFIRQNRPGKRMAIGLVMRAIIRSAPEQDDLVVFMDGDTVFGAQALARSAAMFGADPGLQALTTDEQVITYGPGWMRRWLDLRFAQRRLAMQSHVMSDKVLTLTGRMSMFRAGAICTEAFVRCIEADHLDHWLWGRFRFLSGDDKSTWYYMLTQGAKMGYVPDACMITIERVSGSGGRRMVQNLRRWSGNMLRNGTRALQLGPRQVGPFIWWCVLDQRIAIWTMLVSPALVLMAMFTEPGYLIGAALWVVLSRLVLSLYLMRYARAADMSWPFLLYANQLVNACVKVWIQFYLHKQKWSNRRDQRAGCGRSRIDRFKAAVAGFQLVTALAFFLQAVAWLSGRTDGFGAF